MVPAGFLMSNTADGGGRDPSGPGRRTMSPEEKAAYTPDDSMLSEDEEMKMRGLVICTL